MNRELHEAYARFDRGEHLPPNASPAADAEFIRLLANEDPPRHARLMSNMRRAAHASQLAVEGSEAQRRQQDVWDRMAAKRAKATAVLPVGWLWCAYDRCGEPFRPVRAGVIYCGPRCRYRGEQGKDSHETAPEAA